MFLDRPKNALLLVSQADVQNIAASEIAVREALHKEGDDIALYFVEEFEKKKDEIAASNKTLAIASENLKRSRPEVITALNEMGFVELKPGEETTNASKRLLLKPQEEIVPEIISFQKMGVPETVVVSWKAIGLRSAPTLQVEPLKQKTISQYAITGSARGETLKEKKS